MCVFQDRKRITGNSRQEQWCTGESGCCRMQSCPHRPWSFFHCYYPSRSPLSVHLCAAATAVASRSSEQFYFWEYGLPNSEAAIDPSSNLHNSAFSVHIPRPIPLTQLPDCAYNSQQLNPGGFVYPSAHLPCTQTRNDLLATDSYQLNEQQQACAFLLWFFFLFLSLSSTRGPFGWQTAFSSSLTSFPEFYHFCVFVSLHVPPVREFVRC